jgi:hypothetical protein
MGMDVRRLAAVDMWGGAGRRWRRRVILAEFAVGLFGLITIAVLIGRQGQEALTYAAAAWFLGVGLNYLPLLVHAISLSRPGRLEDELDGVDILAELRSYTVRQAWVLVPLALVIMALMRRRPRPGTGAADGQNRS